MEPEFYPVIQIFPRILQGKPGGPEAVSYTHLDVYKSQVYVDSNVMAGRTGSYDKESEVWSDVI